MYYFRKILFLTLLLTSDVNSLSIPLLSDMQDLIALAGDVQTLAAGNLVPFKNLVAKAQNPLNLLVDILSSVEDSVTDMESTFSRNLDKLIQNVLARIPLEGQIGRALDEFYDCAMRVEDLYENFEFYVPLLSKVDLTTLEYFIDVAVGSDYGGLMDILEQMYRLVVPDRTASEMASFFELLERRNNLYDPAEMCESNGSPQQIMYHLLNVILLNEVRAFATISFAYKAQAFHYNVSIEDEVLKARATLIMRVSDYINEAQKYLKRAPRVLYRCDPPKNIPDFNYIDFGNIFSLYIINEWQAWRSETCKYTCSKVDTWNTYRHIVSSDTSAGGYWMQQKPCRGHIYNCFNMGGRIELCEYNSTSPFRYQYAKMTSATYGTVSDCTGTYNKLLSDMSGFYSCDNCACHCSESRTEVMELRSFSLRPQITDVENNMVLSNVKFTKKNNMVHLQIEQSPLLSGGEIDKNNSTWIELEEMLYSTGKEGGSFYGPNNDYEWYVRGQDFQFLQRPGTYGFDIDDVLAPEGYVVTGARLYHSYPQEGEYNGGSDLHLHIHVSPFDFRTGKLTISEDTPSMWLTPQNQPNMPEEYSKSRYVIPTGGNADPWPSPTNDFHIKSNMEINFEPSFYGKDAGRRTIPYVDIRPAVTINSAAIGGMGFVYRSQENYIGFIALKLFTIDISNTLNSQLTQEQYKFYKSLYRKKLNNEVQLSD